MSRADHITETTVRPLRYVDFSSGFERNPLTGDLSVVTDAEAVKQSVRNLVLTKKGERPFQPNIGCKVWDLLFEPLDDVTLQVMQSTIEQTIQFHEKRAQLVSVNVLENSSGDGLDVTVTFYVVNLPEPVTISVFLKRAR